MKTTHVWRPPRDLEPREEAGVCVNCGLFASEGGTECTSPLTDDIIDHARAMLQRPTTEQTRESLDDAMGVIEALRLERDAWRRRAIAHGCADGGDADCG